ncbi:isocitrate lyase/PEP mutase family protein [Ramlibacter sp. G-1-2-2]|uniref:Isocitrate lyase/PEP mutase family protein n=1 Tax=Ramlibacter agri TaxID=2728837 RepID=A0A848HB66_9BURK|nr:isocitrate lyase/PEP mutase family protein [Ramlibacter agri]NML46730.1 isocitrate lyase/PEP mutase family protein [Ramlibacter agri]
MHAAQQLRTLLSGRDMVVAPGAYDCISARTIEQAGFRCAYMTGSGTAAARGFPDLGLLTMSEMVDNAAAIARTVAIPLVADADTGYGNELNVHRTVREYESRNVAGIHIEDQVAPKRCGHLDGKEVVPRAEFITKIRAAVQARTQPAFLVIARTDARAVLGFDEAIERANAALAAGADMAFVEATESLEEMAQVPRRVTGPCLLNIAAGGRTPLVPLADAAEMGYRLAILPGMLMRNAVAAFDEVLQDLARTGVPKPVRNMGSIAAGHQRFGADAWRKIQEQAQVRT